MPPPPVAAAPAFDPFIDVRRFARFARAFIRQTKGVWAGSPLVMEPWQLDLVKEILRRDPQTGQRVVTEALVGIPRKNGKSTLLAALALYFLVVEGAINDPGAEVYAAAGSKEQARIVFDQTKAFVLGSPRLLEICDVQKDRILVKETGAVFRVLSSDGGLQHGLNPSLVIIDELHAHKNGELYEALTTADMARAEPLVVTITTAGTDVDTSILGDVFTRCYGPKPVVDRERGWFVPAATMPADMFARWWTVADEDIDDPAAWKRANPGSWVTVEKLMRKAPPRTQKGSWLRLHLNRWTRGDESWLPSGTWEKCEVDEDEPLHLEAGDKVWAAVDMGRKHDTAAVVVVGEPKHDPSLDRMRRPVRARVWGVQPDPDKPAPACHELVDGDRIPFVLVEDYILELHREFDVQIVGYDPWRFDRSAETLADQGADMEEFPQTNERMAPASQHLYDDVVELGIAHDGDPVLTAHIDAAVAKPIGRDTFRLDKGKSRQPMDAAVALAIAREIAEADEADGGSGFTIRAMDERGDATPDPADAPELDARIADLVYRRVPIDWASIEGDARGRLADELRRAAETFFDRDEDPLAELCLEALGQRHAAPSD